MLESVDVPFRELLIFADTRAESTWLYLARMLQDSVNVQYISEDIR